MSSSKPITFEAVSDKYLELLGTYTRSQAGAEKALREANFIRSVCLVRDEKKQGELQQVKSEMFATDGTCSEPESKIYKESEIARLKQMKSRYLDGDENKLSDWERLTISSIINVAGFDTNIHYTTTITDEKARSKVVQLIDEAQFTVWNELRPFISLNQPKGDTLNKTTTDKLREMKTYLKDNALALHTVYQLYKTCEAQLNTPELKTAIPDLLKILKSDAKTTPDQRIQEFNNTIIKGILKQKKTDYKKQQTTLAKISQWTKPQPPLLALRHELNSIYKEYEKVKPKVRAAR